MTPQRLAEIKRLHIPRNWDDIDDLYAARTELLNYVTELENQNLKAVSWLAEVLELPEESVLETILERANV